MNDRELKDYFLSEIHQTTVNKLLSLPRRKVSMMLWLMLKAEVSKARPKPCAWVLPAPWWN